MSFESNEKTKLLVKEIRKLRATYKAWKRKKENKDLTNPDIEALIEKKISQFKKESERLGNIYVDFDSQGVIRSEGYRSKHCIFNTKKINNKLDSIDMEEYADAEEKTYIEDLITSGEEKA